MCEQPAVDYQEATAPPCRCVHFGNLDHDIDKGVERQFMTSPALWHEQPDQPGLHELLDCFHGLTALCFCGTDPSPDCARGKLVRPANGPVMRQSRSC